MTNPNFVYFGTSEFSVYVLEALFEHGQIPSSVVTFPDKPKGRNLVLMPNPVKVWATEKKIPVVEISTFKDPEVKAKLEALSADVFVVASFGKIIPSEIIYLPKAQTLNVHPSLLPKLRGPAPIQGAILHEDMTGVTIMRLNEKMDEGPIVAQSVVDFPEWPLGYTEAEKILGKAGGKLLADTLPKWINGEISEIPQDHSKATYTHMIKKEDADVTRDSPEIAHRKVLAYEVWPRARKGTLIITKAHLEKGVFIPDRVIPPGKKEMPYTDYLRGHL